MVRIYPDVEFWNGLLAKAQEFFLKVCLPELVANHYTRAHMLARETSSPATSAMPGEQPSLPTSSTAQPNAAAQSTTPCAQHLKPTSSTTQLSAPASSSRPCAQPLNPISSNAQPSGKVSSTKPRAQPSSQKPRDKENKNPQESKTKKLYCICRGHEDGSTMVRCDTLRCPIKWFHVRCVLDHVPNESEKWYCATCTNNKRKRQT